ncbi:MAG: hypothetical protein LBL55_01320 [Propionibacteriaceae bacterium]|jgi:predicted nucleic acid-binding protein|nr:hypothetical protein [Propionibacteriaceae bacterium]
MRTVVLDSEALSALARKDRSVAVTVHALLKTGQPVVVPTVVLVEVMNGQPRDAAVRQAMKGFFSYSLEAPTATAAGALRERAESVRRKKRDLSVDAVVAQTAIDLAPSTIITADVFDLRILTADADVVVVPVA